jgi:2-polyprenyl-3-methyl-5-hydroxy-6-metoxy-1,4-benzoquinol methylase
MAVSDGREEELRRLIEATTDSGDGPRGWRALARRAVRRLEGGRGARQRQFDHAVVGRLAEIVEAIGQLQKLSARSDQRLAELDDWVTQTSARGDEVAGRLEATITDQQRALGDLHRLVPGDAPLHTEDGFRLETFDAGLGGQVVGFRDGGLDVGGGLYLGFEDFFRGREEAIRQRQHAYLPFLQGRGPVLDVGCGRGELLEMLRDDGTEAHGIDLDPAMVEHCRAKGLPVEMGNAVTYLEGLPDGSLGAVFAAQVIEHLPYPELVRFLRAIVGKLVPGAIAILETVNPHAPQALKHFWIDPTHQHPLFPETMLALCRLTGFDTAYVWHPQGHGEPDRDRVEQLDYAVIAETAALA